MAECRDISRPWPDLPAAFQQTIAKGRLFDPLPIGIYCCDRDGRLLHFNKKAAELWGRAPRIGDTEERFCGSHKLFSLDGNLLPHAATPMAEVLHTGVPARDRSVIIERPDGTRNTVLVNIEPVFDEAGKLAGAVNCFQDITELKRRHDALRAKERHLHSLLEALPAAVYTTDAAGRVTFYNQAAVELVGNRPELGRAEWCVSARLYWPDGKPMPHDECPMAVALKQQRPIRGAEAIAERPDGTRFPFLAFPTPLYDESGRLAGAVNMLVDITERKQAEERQQLLLGELNHRVKNTLATVQAIASQTLRRNKTPAHFVSSFSGRLEALARAHALLTQATWQGADVMELVRDQLLLGGPHDDRITCSGPSLILEPQPALHLALALHELGTNARKHGALSVRGGRLSVSWKVQSSGGRSLLLHWIESGGPPVSAPAARGFGTYLVEQSMQAHGGEACICYAADGVTCEMSLPLPDKARLAPGGEAAMRPTWIDRPAVQQPPDSTPSEASAFSSSRTNRSCRWISWPVWKQRDATSSGPLGLWPREDSSSQVHSSTPRCSMPILPVIRWTSLRQR